MGARCFTSPLCHTTVLALILLMSTCRAFELSGIFHCAINRLSSMSSIVCRVTSLQ